MGKNFSYLDYPYGWHTWSRFLRETRNDWRCEWCGAAHKHPHPLTGKRVVLTLAHLNHDHTDNNPRNLAVLCNRCHLNHDRADNQRRIRNARLRHDIECGHLFGDTLKRFLRR